MAQAEEQLKAARQTQHVQQILSRLLLYRGPINGASNDDLLAAIWLFRYRWNMRVSSDIDVLLMERLDIALNAWIHPHPRDLRALVVGPPSEADYARLASQYNLDGATIRAIAAVEGDNSFGPDGRMIILFAPTTFSKRTSGRFDTTNPDVSHPRSDVADYRRSHEARWALLEEAYALDPEVAYESAMYGPIQIMGYESKNAEFETAGEYVRFMSQSEANQVEAMLRYARVHHLIDELQRHDWAGIGRAFYGPGDTANKHGVRLAEAYARISAEMAAEYKSVLPDGRALSDSPP